MGAAEQRCTNSAGFFASQIAREMPLHDAAGRARSHAARALQAAARPAMSADAQAHRRAAVEKFRQKRKQRTFEKKVGAGSAFFLQGTGGAPEALRWEAV